MVKNIFILLFLALVLIPSAQLNAETPEGLSVTYAAGNNFSFPGAFRIGWKDWEYGLLNARTIGAHKLFFFSRDLYSSLGLGLVDFNLGFTASFGYWVEMFWGIGFRVEISANTNLSGVLHEQGVIGLAYEF